jgi:hypothetical protein
VSTGRNDPCPCGSGLKYKKCCFARTSPQKGAAATPGLPAEVLEEFRKATRKHAQWQMTYGQIPAVVTAELDGRRLVAVGNQLLWSSRWSNFHEFLFDYVVEVFGYRWWSAEQRRPSEERHAVLKWRSSLTAMMRRQTRGSDGLYRAMPDGPSEAYLLLGYDLYVLRNLNRLQDAVVNRLRRHDLFQGARYELSVAATCIKAGLDVEYDDETNKKQKHPEFRATDRRTGQAVFVEAKSRRAELGSPVSAPTVPLPAPRTSIKRLINRALNKGVAGPFVIFLDLNLPRYGNDGFAQPWLTGVLDAIKRSAGRKSTAFNLLVMTNCLPEASQPERGEPTGDIYGLFSPSPLHRMQHPKVLQAIYNAASVNRRVPREFPE